VNGAIMSMRKSSTVNGSAQHNAGLTGIIDTPANLYRRLKMRKRLTNEEFIGTGNDDNCTYTREY
jgi:hypothetical protein